jgi:hypothetical protein
MDGRRYEIAGVLPASFRFLSVPRDADVWLPLGSDPFTDRRYARGLHSAGVLGRLKNDVTLAQAQDASPRLRRGWPRPTRATTADAACS